ncbi:MAG: hypothetical protein HKM94_01540 [Halobacteria archaeon]|nr:hypothetical protein [Halobacteria archaeon]
MDEAIEHLVDGIDPNMRLVSGYKKKLWQAVDKALIYIDWLVDTIPGPVECNKKSFATDPLVNAMFATVEDIQKIFSQSEALRAFFSDPMNVNVDECYALICMEKEEHTRFGMELEGDFVKKDVPQVSVNFFAHSILSPAATEKEVRSCLKQCIFDALISNTFESVMANHMREAGTDEYRKILDRRYKANQAWGQELTDLILSVRADAISAKPTSGDLTSIQNESTTRDSQLETPGDRLTRVMEILAHPESMIRLNHISMNLTRLGIKVKEGSSQSFNKIEFTELAINDIWRRIIVLVKYPRNEMLSKADLF